MEMMNKMLMRMILILTVILMKILYQIRDPFYEHGCEEGLDLDDLGCDSWSNRVDYSVKSTSPTHSYNFSAEEEALYARRFEEGYEAWLIVHHHSAAAISNTILVFMHHQT